MLNELGLGSQESSTYQQCQDSTQDIVNKNIEDLKSVFGFRSINKENLKLPKIYWLPKKHKHPTKFRFIIASPVCSIKPLANVVTSIFKLFYRQVDMDNKKARFFSGVNTFWVIQSNRPF